MRKGDPRPWVTMRANPLFGSAFRPHSWQTCADHPMSCQKLMVDIVNEALVDGAGTLHAFIGQQCNCAIAASEDSAYR